MKNIIKSWLLILFSLIVLVLVGVVVYLSLYGGAEGQVVGGSDIDRRRQVEKIRYVDGFSYNVTTAESLLAIDDESFWEDQEKPMIIEVTASDDISFEELNRLLSSAEFRPSLYDCLTIDEVEIVFTDRTTLSLQVRDEDSCGGYYFDGEKGEEVIVPSELRLAVWELI